MARLVTMRATGFTLVALTLGVTVSRADVIQSTVVLPPVSGAYTFMGAVCVSGLNRCTENASVSGFNIMTSTQENGNEIVTVAAHYSADVFTDHGGVPGTFVGHLILPGTAEFTYVGRDPSVNPLGTFATDLTEFDFKGMLNGKTFEIKQNSVKESSGETTILEVTSVPPIEYAVSGSLNLFGEFSFNGRPFVPGPGRMATLTAIPEPQTGALADLILVGVLGIASRRRVRAKTHSVTPIKSNGL